MDEKQLRTILREEVAAVVDQRVRLILHGDQAPDGSQLTGADQTHAGNLDSIRRDTAAVRAKLTP